MSPTLLAKSPCGRGFTALLRPSPSAPAFGDSPRRILSAARRQKKTIACKDPVPAHRTDRVDDGAGQRGHAGRRRRAFHEAGMTRVRSGYEAGMTRYEAAAPFPGRRRTPCKTQPVRPLFSTKRARKRSPDKLNHAASAHCAAHALSRPWRRVLLRCSPLRRSSPGAPTRVRPSVQSSKWQRRAS